MLFERGPNVKQMRRWLAYHSPNSTLDAYVHLFDERLPEPARLGTELALYTAQDGADAHGEGQVPGGAGAR